MPGRSAILDTLTGLAIVGAALALLGPPAVRALAPGEGPRAKHYQLRTSDGRDVKESSPVRMYGLTVGHVEEIDIDWRGDIVVHFRVDAEYASAVRADARAALVAPLAVGLTHVLLDPGTPGKDESPGGRIEVFTPQSLEQKFEWSIKKSEEFAAKIEPLILKAEVSAANSEWISRHLDDGDGVLGALMKGGGPERDVARAVTAFATLAADVRDVTDAIARREGALGRVMNPDDPLFASARKVSLRAEETIEAFDRAKGRLEGAAGVVTRRLEKAIASVNGVPSILADARAIATELGHAYDKTTRKVGTIGSMINDATLVSDLRRWIAEISQSSDSTDHAPINYVTGLGLKPTVPNHPDPDVGPSEPGK